MSIKARLLMLLLAAITLALIISGTGWRGLTTSEQAITEINDVRMPSLIGLQTLNEAQTDIRLRTIETAIWELDYQATAFFADTLKRKENAWKKAQRGLDIYLPLPQTKEETALWQQFEKEWAAWKAVDSQLTELMKKLATPHSEEDQKAIFVDFYQLYEQQRKLFNASEASLAKIIELNLELAKMQGDKAHQVIDNNSHIMLIVVVIGILLLTVFGWWVLHVVTTAIANVVTTINQVVQTQRFQAQLPKRRDEFDAMNQSMNQLLQSLDSAIQEANRVVTAIANADFEQRMESNYNGDLDNLKQGINASAISVSFMMNELGQVMQAMHAGRFDTKMDTKVPQAFRSLVETALTRVQSVIQDINLVMSRIKEGDFSTRVQADAQGELLNMKKTINQSMDMLELALKSITQIVVFQSQGDLTHSCSAQFHGQLEETKNALNATNEKLQAVVSEAVNSSNTVNEAAHQVSQGAADLSARVQEQAAALEETSATMHQMATAVQMNTDNAQQVAGLTRQALAQAGAGVDVMQQTINAMQSIQESSTKIADIVSLIDSIAFQTNLLALNAAVEAARAGEHGRGFAVVASEVRALAGKSADAAKDIKALIDDSVYRIDAGTQLADKSGEMLNGISGAISEVAEMIEAIANASKEQSIGINQVHKAVADIDRVTQENAALVEETTAAAESLSAEANRLQADMSFFKTHQAVRQASHKVGIATLTDTSHDLQTSPTNKSTQKMLGRPQPTQQGEWRDF
jgi:methyl-accepting chemotaxis protein